MILLLLMKHGLERLLKKHVSVNCYHWVKLSMFLDPLVNVAGCWDHLQESSINLHITSSSRDTDYATFEHEVVNSYYLRIAVKISQAELLLRENSIVSAWSKQSIKSTKTCVRLPKGSVLLIGKCMLILPKISVTLFCKQNWNHQEWLTSKSKSIRLSI